MLFILLIVVLPFVSADRCASVPPSLWCSSKELSKECGFEDLCNRYHTATHNQRINITVLMEALCPGCQHFIVDELYPNIYKNFAGFVNIEFVPYGNAKVVNGTIQCQHGPEECSINRFESCLIDSVQTQELYVPLIYCIESNLQKKSFQSQIPFDKASAKCFRTLSVGEDIQRLIQSCLVSRLGEQLQEKAAEQTENVWPDKHRHVPWVVINGISLESEQSVMDHLPYLICGWYTGDKKIPYCRSDEKKKHRMLSLNL
ncbi:gamma interferon inducible lysosomal thiol reductase [Ancylostoma caninum]|uniref:Gamma interferon inducible lysosomal thiol reductase n=1 Tax=Ancylostoma caninum TaxID=29170 RepID=A0A368GMH7_ANCCA|nr:gamma interferon inducible lysosomal thiol reductase [Ancylostoma caninum]